MSALWSAIIRHKIIALFSAFFIISGGYVLSRKIPSRASSSDEFFAHNPSLTRPEPKIKEEPLPSRGSDDFLSSDFHLTPGRAFPLQLKSKTSFQGGDGHSAKTSYDGVLTLHSVAWSSHRLQLLAEFKISQFSPNDKLPASLKSEIGMPGTLKKDANLFLVNFDPAGKIEAVFAAIKNTDEDADSLKIQALAMVLRRLPELKKGDFTKKEPDLHGNGVPIHYTISDLPDEALKILGSVQLEEEMGKSPAKAAAAGAPVLAQISLQNKQEQSFEWVWNQKSGRPTHQLFNAKASMVSYGKEFGAYIAELSAEWKPDLATSYTAQDLKRFTYSISFQRFLNSQDKSRKKLATKDASNMSWSEINGKLAKLRSKKLSDKERDQLFGSMAEAVRGNPGLIDTVAQMALTGDPGSEEVSMALGALGYEGSPRSQDAMVSVFKRKDAAEIDRQKVMTELVLCSQALSLQTKIFLKEEFKRENPMISHLANGAGLALGASIAHDGDPQTVNLIKTEWAATTGVVRDTKLAEDAKIYLLATMGNSKSDAFLPEVKAATTSSRSEMRSAAADALRFAQDDKSRNLLIHALENDAETEVRISAAHSMRYQPFDQRSYVALQNCVSSGSEVGIKLECYRALAVNLGQPGVREWMQGRMGAESDVQVKSLIKDALAELPQ